jgi:hypothetical protein
MNFNRSACRGFTLMEMVTSCLIVSLLMVSMGYGLKLALVSTGSGAAYATSSLEATDLVQRVTDDLNEAIGFTEKSTNAVTFTVPERDGDGQPEKIRYAWYGSSGGTITIPGTSDSSGSGSGGSTSSGGLLGGLIGGLLTGGSTSNSGGSGTTISVPVPAYTLTKQINDGSPSALGRDVRAFNFAYLYRSMSPPTPAASDRLLWSCDPTVLGTNKDGQLDLSKWFAATFLPSAQLPIGTTSFSITRIAVCLKIDTGTEGLVRMSFRPAGGTNVPAGSFLENSVAVQEVSLSDSYTWVEFPFTTLTNLAPGTKYSFIVQGATGGTNVFGDVNWVQTASVIPLSTWFSASTNGGGTWSAASTLNCLRFRVYGTTTP